MDLIADVMNNASPAKVRTASLRLEQLSRLQNGEKFAAQPGLKSDGSLNRSEGLNASKLAPVMPNNQDRNLKKQAMLELETVLATKMVEAMMPKDQSRIYGDGTAGEIWRGMHIDLMGKAIGQKGLLSTNDPETRVPDVRPLFGDKNRKIVPYAG